MPKKKLINWLVIGPLIKKVYADLGVKPTIDYVYKHTGVLLTRDQLVHRARKMGVQVSAETRSRQASEINIARRSDKTVQRDAAIRMFYSERGGAYVSELTGIPKEVIARRANVLGITLSPAQRRKVVEKNVAKRKVTYTPFVENLSKVEKLALYEPWGSNEREPKETYIRSWPN